MVVPLGQFTSAFGLRQRTLSCADAGTTDMVQAPPTFVPMESGHLVSPLTASDIVRSVRCDHQPEMQIRSTHPIVTGMPLVERQRHAVMPENHCRDRI